MASNIPITTGQGQASVATEQIGDVQYQKIKVVGGQTGSTSVMGINPDTSINVSVLGTVAVTGSIVALGSPSISGAVNVSGSVLLGNSNASVITVSQSSSILAVPVGSVVTVFQSSSVIAVATGSVVAIPTGNQSVSGALNVSGSVMLGSSNASVITLSQDSSVIAINAGSVVTVSQGSVITVLQSSSIIAVNAGSVVSLSEGSVITVFQSPSIVGTYTEDAAHSSTSKGLFVLGVRNDTLASVTGADNDYSPFTVGPVGEQMAVNAPITKWVQGTADLRGGAAASGGSVAVIAAQGSSIFTYVTAAQVANFGPSSVLVTFSGATSSVIGYTIAPAGGGSNIVFGGNALKTNANGVFSASVGGLSSVLVSAQGFISKV